MLDVTLKNFTMGYSIHIQHTDDEELELEEWLAAVEQTDGCRVKQESGHTIVNPKTGEKITMGGSAGDAEIYDPDEEEWVPALHWYDGSGRVSINSRAIGDESGCLVGPIWDVIRSLAMILGAQVSGDEGEVYNLETGSPE